MIFSALVAVSGLEGRSHSAAPSALCLECRAIKRMHKGLPEAGS